MDNRNRSSKQQSMLRNSLDSIALFSESDYTLPLFYEYVFIVCIQHYLAIEKQQYFSRKGCILIKVILTQLYPTQTKIWTGRFIKRLVGIVTLPVFNYLWGNALKCYQFQKLWNIYVFWCKTAAYYIIRISHYLQCLTLQGSMWYTSILK